jgi:hypothetical protein
MFMRQILADAISKFQKFTRQMLCDKCSKNDVTLIPQNVDFTSLLHLLFGVLRIFGTLIKSNRKRSHDCSDCPYSKAGAARTVM